MFAGKVIAITGASEGIGAELARQAGLWLQLPAPGVVDGMTEELVKRNGDAA